MVEVVSDTMMPFWVDTGVCIAAFKFPPLVSGFVTSCYCVLLSFVSLLQEEARVPSTEAVWK